MNQVIRILGVDPGLRHTGWGVITMDGPRLAWVAHGVIHPDLNVKNVLLVRAPRGTLTAMVIDVDVVQWGTDRSPTDIMAANVARLSRSLRKWRTQFGCDISDGMVNRFASDALAATPARVRA